MKMIVVNMVIVEKEVGFHLECNLLSREDATEQEGKMAKMFEGVLEKAVDTLAELNGATEETYKKKRID